MSTQVDRIVLGHYLSERYHKRSDLRVLYVGSRDVAALEVVRSRFPSTDTLDSDPSLNPTLVVDLNLLTDSGPVLSAPQYDLVVVPYVLMYLRHPLEVLKEIGKRWSPTVVVQENVSRDRPPNDPWPDLNRFVCGDRPSYIDFSEVESRALRSGKRLVRLPSGCDPHYYPNGSGTSALWTIPPGTL